MEEVRTKLFTYVRIYRIHLIALPLSIVSAFYRNFRRYHRHGGRAARDQELRLRNAIWEESGFIHYHRVCQDRLCHHEAVFFSLGRQFEKAHKAPSQVDREQHRL